MSRSLSHRTPNSSIGLLVVQKSSPDIALHRSSSYASSGAVVCVTLRSLLWLLALLSTPLSFRLSHSITQFALTAFRIPFGTVGAMPRIVNRISLRSTGCLHRTQRTPQRQVIIAARACAPHFVFSPFAISYLIGAYRQAVFDIHLFTYTPTHAHTRSVVYTVTSNYSTCLLRWGACNHSSFSAALCRRSVTPPAGMSSTEEALADADSRRVDVIVERAAPLPQ